MSNVASYHSKKFQDFHSSQVTTKRLYIIFLWEEADFLKKFEASFNLEYFRFSSEDHDLKIFLVLILSEGPTWVEDIEEDWGRLSAGLFWYLMVFCEIWLVWSVSLFVNIFTAQQMFLKMQQMQQMNTSSKKFFALLLTQILINTLRS